MSIGDNIKRLRESRGLKQPDLAQICGVTTQAISTWETGIRAPRMGAVEKMAAYFGVKKSDILDEEPDNAAVFNIFNRLSPEKQRMAIDYMLRLFASTK